MLGALDLAIRCTSVVPEKRPTIFEVVRSLQILEDMARSKTGVSREGVYGKSKRTEQAAGTSDTRSGRKPQTTSYRKEKQQDVKKEVAHAGDLRGDVV
ncbi:hypothetical protein Scep_004351 [Stephania cephalantha]|uniref:Uncharacterized protein n=1 Tax=Stephania cephalantha TaxID=152367 RepID=A0AAP0PVA4_9MAGN